MIERKKPYKGRRGFSENRLDAEDDRLPFEHGPEDDLSGFDLRIESKPKYERTSKVVTADADFSPSGRRDDETRRPRPERKSRGGFGRRTPGGYQAKQSDEEFERSGRRRPYNPETVQEPFGGGDEESRLRPRKTARNKLMDYLARRDYSEIELRQKLGRTYSPEEVEGAITFAKENNWMLPEEELAERVSASLGRRNKGHRYINQFLKAKGLPPVRQDADEEARKALELARSKLAKVGTIDYEGQKKLYRALASRGFDDQAIRSAIAELKKEQREQES